MSHVKMISPGKQILLKVLLMDKRINSAVLLHDEIPESIVINDDGSVTFGRTKKKWWNYIFNDKVTIDFDSLALKMMVAYKKYTPANTEFCKTLTEEIIQNALDVRAYDHIIDKFMLHALIGVSEGDYKNLNLKYLDGDSDNERNQTSHNNKKSDKKNSFSQVVAKGTVYLDLGGGMVPIPIDIVEK